MTTRIESMARRLLASLLENRPAIPVQVSGAGVDPHYLTFPEATRALLMTFGPGEAIEYWVADDEIHILADGSLYTFQGDQLDHLRHGLRMRRLVDTTGMEESAKDQIKIGTEIEKEHFTKSGKPKDLTPKEVAATHVKENPPGVDYYPKSKKPKGAGEKLTWVKK